MELIKIEIKLKYKSKEFESSLNKIKWKRFDVNCMPLYNVNHVSCLCHLSISKLFNSSFYYVLKLMRHFIIFHVCHSHDSL
jgi:hypothetical protein